MDSVLVREGGGGPSGAPVPPGDGLHDALSQGVVHEAVELVAPEPRRVLLPHFAHEVDVGAHHLDRVAPGREEAGAVVEVGGHVDPEGEPVPGVAGLAPGQGVLEGPVADAHVVRNEVPDQAQSPGVGPVQEGAELGGVTDVGRPG